MTPKKTSIEFQKIDKKEFDIPETTFVRDVDNKVFQGIILQCLSKIDGIALLEGNFLDYILGRAEGVKGLSTEQDAKNHTLKVRVEVNIAYGITIPEKAEEIQALIAEELTKYTGLHVAEVHVIFKGLIPTESQKKTAAGKGSSPSHPNGLQPRITQLGEEYSDIF